MLGVQAVQGGKAMQGLETATTLSPMENPIKNWTKKTITQQESRIPEMAADAVKQARKET